MNKTIAAVCTALLLTGCISESTNSTIVVEPKDVTHIERELTKHCADILTRQWPVNERVVFTMTAREKDPKMLTVLVNESVMTDTENLKKIKKSGVNNGGACMYENHKLWNATWFDNLKNPEKAVFLSSKNGVDFQ